MGTCFIFKPLTLSINQGVYAFSHQERDALAIPARLYQQIPFQYFGIHAGGAGNFFSLLLAPTNVALGVNGFNFNYSMDITLLGIPHTIEQSCYSTGLMRSIQWSPKNLHVGGIQMSVHLIS